MKLDVFYSDTFPAVYSSLAEIGLSTRPAVILTEIGQELLTVGYHAASLSILQNALKCGTKSLKVRGCILGALTSAHWTAGNYDTAVQFMKEDLQVATQLGDFAAQSRCLSKCFFLFLRIAIDLFNGFAS